MRVTLWLLREHLAVQSIAQLAESYLTGDQVHKFREFSKDWRSIAVGGHMELILDALNSPSKKCHRAHMLAGFASIGDIAMVRQLVSIGVDALSEGLISAVVSRQPEAARFLLSHGATATVTNIHRYDLKGIITDGDYELCKIMKDAGLVVREDFIRDGAISGELSIVDLIPNLTLIEEFEVFTHLCEYRHVNPVETYLSGRLGLSDAERRLWASNGLTYAVQTPENYDVVELLLTHNAEPNYGIGQACQGGQFDTIKILIDAGATECTCGKELSDHTIQYSKKRRLDTQVIAKQAFDAEQRKLVDETMAARNGLPRI